MDRTFDLIVIGAGINGAGIARDAALRGLRVLLVDKGDVGGGTTSWSTRLIHGGLRYLEHAEIPLVRESLREREILLHTAPHLVRPLPLLIPLYKGARRGLTLVRAGMLAYDALSLGKSLPRHGILSRAAALRREPGLNPDGLRAAAIYHDAQVQYPERLTLENVLAARQHGAAVLTYTRVDGILRDGNVVRGVYLVDSIGGTRSKARAPITVNAAGPWADMVLEELEPFGRRLIGGTKGSHIVVNPFPGAPREALYVEARTDGRPYFIIPWNGLYLIGTTDHRYQGDPDAAVADDAEIDYLIQEANRAVPTAHLTRDSVLYCYAGVRPLPYHPAAAEGSITRRHIIHDHAPELEGLISIVGGKLTTYRNLAAQTVDLVCRKLGTPLLRPRTDRIPLPGAQTADFTGFAAEFMAASEVDGPVARRLLRVYGTRAWQVLERADGDPALRAPLAGSDAIAAEVLFAFETEMARTLTDVLMRRTMLGLGTSLGIGTDRAAAEVAKRYLGWDGERAEREVGEYRWYLRRLRPWDHWLP